MGENVGINFELLGSADSLRSALNVAKAEMASSGQSLASNSGQAAQQISAVFAQALNRIAQEAERVNNRLASETDELRQRANLVARELVPQSLSKANLVKNLLGGDEAFTELRQQLEQKLGTALTASTLKAIKAPDLRNHVREAYADLYISANQGAINQAANADLSKLSGFRKNIESFLEKDIKGNLQNNLLKNRDYLKAKFPGVFSDTEGRSKLPNDKFLESALTSNVKQDFGISEAALKKTDGSTENLRKRAEKIVAVLRRYEDELDDVRRRIADPASIPRDDSLNVYAGKLEDAAKKVRTALGNYSEALRRKDTIEKALAAPKSLAERGTSIAILSAFDQTKEAVAARRAEVQQLLGVTRASLKETYEALRTPGISQKDEKALNTRAAGYTKTGQDLHKLLAVLDQVDDSFRRAETAANQFAASLGDRGISDGKLSATGKSVQQLRRDRADLRKVQIQIENELKDATARIGRAAKNTPEATQLAQSVSNLRAQRQQVRAALSGFSDELGNQLRRSPLGRIKDYLQFSVLAGGVYQIASAIKTLTREVFSASAEFQRLRTSFVAVLAEPALAKGGIGEKSGLTPDLLNQLNLQSEQLFKRTQLNAIKTVATTKEYVSTLLSALAVGQQIGLSMEQTEELTLNFIRAAGAFGIEQEKVGSSIAQIFSGSVRVTNQLARNLGLATKEQRDLLKEAIKSGTLYEFLLQKTRAFAETGKQAEDNFINVSAAIADIFQLGGSDAIAPLFQFINSKLVELRDAFVGRDATSIFKAPLVLILNRVRDTLIELLPNINSLTEAGTALAGTLFRSLTGEGVSALKLILNLLSAILNTINQIIGGTNNVLSPIVRLVPFLLIARTAIGGINAILATLANTVGKVVDAAGTAAGNAVNAASTVKAGANQVKTPGYSGGTGGIDFGKVSVQANSAAANVQSFGLRVQGAIGALQAGLAVFGAITTVIGAGILVITVAVNLWREYSGAAARARQEENLLNKAITDSVEKLRERVELGKLAVNILEAQAAAAARAKGAENDSDILATSAKLRAFFNDAEILQLQAGKISDELREKIRENQRFITESFTETANTLKEFVDADIASIIEARNKLETNVFIQQGVLNRFGIQNSTLVSDAADDLGAQALAAQRAAAELGIKNFDFVNASEQQLIDIQAQAKQLEEIFRLVGDVSNAATQDYEIQVDVIARLKQKLNELKLEQQGLNKQTKEGQLRNIVINESLKVLSNQITALTGGILDNVRANVLSKEETLKKADADIVAAKAALTHAKSQLLVNQSLLEGIQQFRDIDKVENPLNPILDAKYDALIAKFKANGANLQKDIEVQQNIISTNVAIRDALTAKAPPAGDETKYKATRDVLQDFLADFNKKLEVIKGINEAILKNEAEINASRKRIRDSLAEGGAISIADLGKEERAAVEEEFELTSRGIKAQIDFIDANIEAAKAVAKRAEANANVKGAQGDRKDLSPDERDRVGNAEDDLIKKKIELQGQLSDATRKFEAEISQSVTSEVKKRLDARQKELDQIPQIISLFVDAEKTFAQQLARFNLISAAELNRIEVAGTATERSARAKRLVQEIFPLADPAVNTYVKNALNDFTNIRKALADKGDSRFVTIAGDTLKLKNLLAKDFPDSIEGATERIKDYKEAAVSVITGLKSEVNFEGFKARADEIFAQIEVLTKIAADNASVLKTGVTTPELEKSIASAEERRAKLRKDAQDLFDDVRKSSISDAPLIQSYAKLAQALADTAFVTPEKLHKLEIAYLEEVKLNREDVNKQAIFAFEQTQKKLELEFKLLDVEKSKLDFSQQVLNQKKELGLLSASEFRAEQRRLIEAQLANNRQNVALQDRKLRTSFASISASGLENATDGAKDLLFEVAESMTALSAESNDLRVQLLLLGSVFVDAAEGFGKISSAFGEFGEGTISKFSGVFSAVENLFRELEKSRLRSQGKEILTAPQTFAKLVTTAGKDFHLSLESISKLLEEKGKNFKLLVDTALDGEKGFVSRVQEAGKLFREAVLPQQPTAIYVGGESADGYGDDNITDRQNEGLALLESQLGPAVAAPPIIAPAEPLKKALDAYVQSYADEFGTAEGITAKQSFFGKISSFVTKNIGAILEAVASLVSGFARGGAGGIISGVGGAVSAVGGLFANSSNAFLKNLPAVGAIFGVVGGIFDVFAAKAKAKAEAFAKTVGEGIDDIKQAFNEGKISLAEAISQINAQLSTARAKLTGGKTGKKGGNAAFAQLEQQAKEAQEELRRQAEATQKEFLEALNLLRKPAELRDIITQINDARKKAEEFLRSFEDQDGLIQATQEAMEFFRLTIGEIRDGIEKSLKDLRQQLKDAAEQFEKSRRDILLQGRIDPRVSEAENKRKQLIDLEREFRERQKDLLNQIATEQTKLDLVNKRAEIEFKIGQYIERSAAALAAAATTLGNVFNGLPGHGGGAGGYGNYGDFLNSPQVGDLIMNNKIDVNVNGSSASAQDIGVAVADHLRLAGRTQYNRQGNGSGSFRSQSGNGGF